jgi:hypothetical protein
VVSIRDLTRAHVELDHLDALWSPARSCGPPPVDLNGDIPSNRLVLFGKSIRSTKHLNVRQSEPGSSN